MHEFSRDFLRCVRCSSKLDLDVFKKENEIEEGILECKKCSLSFPIINKIPILWDDFSKYLSERIMLGGKLFNSASDEKMKKFLKHSLSIKIVNNQNFIPILKMNWMHYQNQNLC